MIYSYRRMKPSPLNSFVIVDYGRMIPNATVYLITYYHDGKIPFTVL